MMKKKLHLFTIRMQMASTLRQISVLLKGVVAMNLYVLNNQRPVLEEGHL